MKFFAFVFFLCASFMLHAQSDKPILGQEYKVVYNPLQTGKFNDANNLSLIYVFNFWGKRIGTRLALRANVLHPDSSRPRSAEMFKTGKVWNATITIPPNGSVLSYYVTDGKTIDMNENKTYTTYIYNGDGTPAQNTHYFMVPFLKMAGASLEEMIEESRKEILTYPENFRAYYQYFQLRLDWKHGSTGMQELIVSELADLGKKYADNIDYLNLVARTYYYLFRNTKVGLEYRNKIPVDKQYQDVVIMYDRDAINQKKEQIEHETSAVRNELINRPAPSFTLNQSGGGTVTPEEFRGKVVLLNFWTTTIRPCKDLMLQLQKIYEKYKAGGLEILGINMDQSVNVIKPFVDQYKLSFPILIADSKVVKDFGVGAIPQVVLLDKNGIVKKYYVGFATGDEKELQSTIESLLKE